MAAYKRKLPGGVTATSYDPGTAPWETNPEQYQTNTEGGLERKPDPNWLERNLWWVGPLAMVGGAGVGALAGGGGAASAGIAPGVVTNTAPDIGALVAPAGAGAAGAAGIAPGVIANTAPNIGAAGGGLANASSLLKDIMTKYAPLGLAGLSAVKGFQQPSANKDLEEIIGLAKSRVQQGEPLFQALNRMALSSLPNYARQ